MFDNPLFFLILISVLSAISDWLGKRRKAARLREMENQGEIDQYEEPLAEETLREERGRSARQEQEDWEERLRRMIGADEEPPPVRQDPQPATQVAPSVDYGYEPPPPPAVYQEPLRRESVPNPIPAAPLAKTSVSLTKSAPAMRSHRSRRKRRSTGINFRSKDSIRKSIVAAVVLGPAKGTGEEADLIQL